MIQIQDIVDCKKYPYVMPFSREIKTYLGVLHIVRGFLSDGASKVIDLCKVAFFAHDRIYVIPYIDGRPIRKYQADLIYGQILFRNWRVLSAVRRPVGLMILGWPAWNHYRKLDKTEPDHWMKHVVPKEHLWIFPSYRTRDARWIGPEDTKVEDLIVTV